MLHFSSHLWLVLCKAMFGLRKRCFLHEIIKYQHTHAWWKHKPLRRCSRLQLTGRFHERTEPKRSCDTVWCENIRVQPSCTCGEIVKRNLLTCQTHKSTAHTTMVTLDNDRKGLYWLLCLLLITLACTLCFKTVCHKRPKLCINHLLYKDEDLSSSPQDSHKSWVQ